MVDTSMDSKWRFYYRLRKFFRTCYVADSRVNAQYERGWNDAVAGMSSSLRDLYENKEPFLATILEDISKPIPRAEVAAALDELLDSLVKDARAEASWGSGTNEDTIQRYFKATIAKLGLATEESK